MMMILLYITTMTISPQQHFDDGKPTRDRGAPERRHTVTHTLVQHLGLWYDRSYNDGMKVICDGGYDGDVVTPTPWIDVLMLPQYMCMKYDGMMVHMMVVCKLFVTVVMRLVLVHRGKNFTSKSPFCSIGALHFVRR